MKGEWKVLLIEDDVSWRRKLTGYLKTEGYSVQEADTYAKARELLRTGRVDLVVLDLRLVDWDETDYSGMDLLDDIDRLAEEWATKTIILTGYGTVEHALEAFKEHGVFDFITKARFNRHEFIQVARAALQQAEAERQAGFVSTVPKTMARHVRVIRCFVHDGPCALEEGIALKPKQAFVAMPFSPRGNELHKFAIKPALKEEGYNPIRANEVVEFRNLTCKICRLIRECEIAIVDISTWNANVMFELGLIYGWGKTAILLLERGRKAPSDLRGMEVVKYDGLVELKKKLRAALRGGVSKR